MRPFTTGLLTGFFLCAAVLLMLAKVVGGSGVTVRLDAEEIAATVRSQVEAEARRQLPLVIQDLERGLPDRVAARLGVGLSQAVIDLYGIKIGIPEDAVRQLRNEVQQMVVDEIHAAVAAADLEGMAAGWGAGADRMVRIVIQEQLEGRLFKVQVLPWLPVVVKVATQ